MHTTGRDKLNQRLPKGKKTHPSTPATKVFSLPDASGTSSSSEDPALEDSSSLSARQYALGLKLKGGTQVKKEATLHQCWSGQCFDGN